jgi:hypothetical protein
VLLTASMNKIFVTHLLLLTCTALFSQNRTEDFEITLPEKKVENSLYKTIQFIDSRYDTAHMGIVQLGAFNKKAKVVPKIPFAIQLAGVMNALTDATAKDGELLFQLRQFNFAELTGAMSEKGYCYLRAWLYSHKNGQYQVIASIDTVILIKAMDVTRALFRNGSKTITNFIADNLLREATGSQHYSLNDIMRIDSIEKRNIPLYTTPVLKEGLYETYRSFFDQIPDRQITAELKEGKPASVKAINKDGKAEKVKAKDIYAIVYQGKPYIATDYGYYPLQKLNDDFYFTGKAEVNAKAGDVIAAGFFFGIIGGLIASDAEATFEMKIDHINGGFIRLREIKFTGE